MAKYRIGLVGGGGITNNHIQGCKSVLSDLGEVVAGCDPNTETLNSFCDQYDLSLRFTDVEFLIGSEEVDVIALLTPPAVRSEVIFPAIERGIHLLIEKPFGETYADAESFVLAAEQAGVALAINHELGFMKDITLMHEAHAAGAIGKIRYIAHDQFQNRTRVRGRRSQETRLEISIFSIHLIDRIRQIADSPPKSVTGVSRKWNPDVKGETRTSLTVQFESGSVGTMDSNWHALTMPENRFRVDGTKGSMLSVKRAVVADEATIHIETLDGNIEQHDCYEDHTFTKSFGESMRQLLLSANSGQEPSHSGRGNLHTMQIVDAAYLSAERGGELVKVEEIINQ